MIKLVIKIIEFYKKTTLIFKNPSCRYIPSCSEYAIEIIEKYGLRKGLIKLLWRICRCNPFFKGGYDPA